MQGTRTTATTMDMYHNMKGESKDQEYNMMDKYHSHNTRDQPKGSRLGTT
jgi:hypothetical protein